MNDVIQAQQLTKVYDSGVQVYALRGVDLTVERATFVAIMGPSGSGKSTMLNILGALELPTEGRLVLEGTDVSALSDDDRTMFRRRRIGFIFQQFNLLPIFSAVENVALPLRLEGIRHSEANERATKMLEVVGLAERRDHLPSQMSGGEQQRVAIARALVANPALILADEPTGNLDSSNGERVVAILRELVDERHQTVVMVTHDSAVASRADRVVYVRDGQIVDDFDPRHGMLDIASVPKHIMNSWGDALGELLRRPGRSLLSLLSVVIAVAAIVAVTSATATTRVAYRTVLQTLSGRADLEVVPRSKGLFKQDVLKEIQAVPGVRAAVPILLQGTNLYTEDARVKVLISGIILDEPESVAGYKITDGHLPEAANEIALEKQLAEELKLAVGGEVKLFTPDLRKPYKISGLVAPENAARLHQGGMILAPLEALQRTFRLKGKVSAIHLFLDDPKQSSEIIAKVSPLLPKQVAVRIPALRNGIAEETLLLTEVSLNMASTLSFTTAVFIVLTVFLMNVSERRRHLSIMRAIGATRGQIMGLVCREAFLMGVVGTIFGIPLGIYGGGFLIHTMAAMLGVTLPHTPDLRWAFAVGALVGPAVCLVAAWYPARKASRVSPLEGMRPTVTVEPQRGHLVTTTVGVIGSLITVLLSIGTARGTIPMWSAVFGVVLALVSLILLLPIALLPSVRILSWPIRQVLGLEGEMSERLVLRHAGRSALTIGVLFIAVAAGVGTSNAVFSVTDDIRTWYQRTITADFLLRAMMPDLSGQAPASMPDSMRDEIASLPEVDKVDAVRFLQIDANGLDAKMVTREFRIYDQVPLNLVTGDSNGMLERLRAGDVVVGTVLAERAGLHVGDTVKVTQGTKTESFRVTGIVSEYTFGGLVVTIDRDVATRLFEIDGVDSFLIQSKPGQSAQLEPKLKAIADQQGLLLSSFGEVLKFVDSTIAGTTGGLWILLALGLLVGALGVINTLTMNVLEETRELGMLRAIGMRRGQIIKTVLGQAGIIGLLGIIAGGFTGLCLARMINISLGSLFGRYISFALRPQFMGLLLLASLAVVLLAALYPARRAAAFSPMEAMRQD